MTIQQRNTVPMSYAEQIIEYITYHGQARAYDLQKTLDISRVSVHKQLRKLVRLGKLKKTGKPPLVFYVLPGTNNKNLIQLEKIKSKAFPILKTAHVKRAALFGSYARGDYSTKSDIDILVELPKNATLLDLAGLKIDLEEKLKKKVDVVEYEGIYPLIKDSVLRYQYPIL